MTGNYGGGTEKCGIHGRSVDAEMWCSLGYASIAELGV